jgi:hypothetical protein
MQTSKIVRKKGNERIFSVIETDTLIVKLAEMKRENHTEWLDPNQPLVILPAQLFLLEYEELI